MDKQTNGWVIAGIASGVLVLFLVISGFSYFSDLKGQIAKSREESSQLQTQLTTKNEEITTKNNTITNLESQKTNLEGKNKDLDSEVVAKRKELEQRLGQVKKLQGSLKTVSGCLVGTMGVIESLKQNNEEMARKSALLMEVTCQESGKIIKDAETFSTNSQTAQY